MEDLYGYGQDYLVRPDVVDYCAIARAALVKAGGPFQSATCAEIASNICGSQGLFRDGSALSNAILQWAGCGPVGGGGGGDVGGIDAIRAAFNDGPPRAASIGFGYAGPGGTVAVNWWLTTQGGKPKALGGASADEVAYKQVVLSLPSSAGYRDAVAQLSIDAGYLPAGIIGKLDSWIAVYQGVGTTAVLLGYQSFPLSGSGGGTGGGLSVPVVLGIAGIAGIAAIAMAMVSKSASKKILIARIQGA